MAEKKKILLIDDEVDLVDMIRFQLESNGFDVTTAHDGEEGMQKLHGQEPDLIILDINMPKMNGLEFMGRILTPHGRPKYPVLVLTARANLEKTFQGMEVDGFMLKPFDIGELIARVQEICEDCSPLVLIIDKKHHSHVQNIQRALKDDRYRVEVVSEPESFSQRSKVRKPSFIIMEYVQDEATGHDVLQRIKAEPLFKDVPVFVYHYAGVEGYREKSLDAGADRYLGQPSSSATILAAMKEFELKRMEAHD